MSNLTPPPIGRGISHRAKMKNAFSFSSDPVEATIVASPTEDSLLDSPAAVANNQPSALRPEGVSGENNLQPVEKSKFAMSIPEPSSPRAGQDVSPTHSSARARRHHIRRATLFSAVSSRNTSGADGPAFAQRRHGRFLRMPLRLVIVVLFCVFTVGPSLTSWMLSWQTGSEGLNSLVDLSHSSLEEVSLELRSLLIARAAEAVHKLLDSAETAMEMTILRIDGSKLLDLPSNDSILASQFTQPTPNHTALGPLVNEVGYCVRQTPSMLMFFVTLIASSAEVVLGRSFGYVRLAPDIIFVTTSQDDLSSLNSTMGLYGVNTESMERTPLPLLVTPTTGESPYVNVSLNASRSVAWDGDIVFNAYIGTPSMTLNAHLPFSDFSAVVQIDLSINTYSISAFLRSLLTASKERMFLAFCNPLGHLVGASHGKFFSHSDINFTAADPVASPAPIELFEKFSALDSNDPTIHEGAVWMMSEYCSWDAIPELNTVHELAGERFWIVSEHLHTKFGAELQLVLFADRASRMGKVEQSQQLTMSNISETNVRLIVILSLVVSVAIVFALLISFILTRSLDRLANGMDALAMLEFRSRQHADPQCSSTDELMEGSRFSELSKLESSYASLERGLRAFIKYVPRDVVKMMLTGEMESENMMTRRVVTILFMDIAGFSSLCEKVSPEVLMKVTTSYLQSMCGCIISSGGVLDKFIGDCIMAMWNAPKRMTFHEAAACEAALEMQRELMELSEQWSEEGLPELRFRVGINTDRVLVGNFGCEYRLNYTSLGDGVNLASRLEAANKRFGTVVLVSSATKLQCGEQFVFRRIAQITVPGKTEILSVYEPLWKQPSRSDRRTSLDNSEQKPADDPHAIIALQSISSASAEEPTPCATTRQSTNHPYETTDGSAAAADRKVLFHWELVDADSLMAMTTAYEQGLEKYEAGSLVEAEQFFYEARRCLLGDGACKLLLELCRQQHGRDAKKSWDGVIHFDKK